MAEYATIITQRDGETFERLVGVPVVLTDMVGPGEAYLVSPGAGQKILISPIDHYGYPTNWGMAPGYSRHTAGAHEAARMVRRARRG